MDKCDEEFESIFKLVEYEEKAGKINPLGGSKIKDTLLMPNNSEVGYRGKGSNDQKNSQSLSS